MYKHQHDSDGPRYYNFIDLIMNFLGIIQSFVAFAYFISFTTVTPLIKSMSQILIDCLTYKVIIRLYQIKLNLV